MSPADMSAMTRVVSGYSGACSEAPSHAISGVMASAENGATIEAQVDEVKKEIVTDMQKELNDRLRKSFSGSKYIKIK